MSTKNKPKNNDSINSEKKYKLLNIKKLIEDIPNQSKGKKKTWKDILLKIYNDNEEKIKKIQDTINENIKEYDYYYDIYPSYDNIFNAFKLCPLHNVKVIILGQDPYHGKGQAHGLSFSVNKGLQLPPSLRNIFKELSTDDELKPKFDINKTKDNGELTNWAKQGVLLLNTSLTVQESEPGSHLKLWEFFTDEIIKDIDSHLEKKTLIYMLWGSHSKKKKLLINKNNKKHLILESVHPSPLSASRGWFGCKHFSKCNKFLTDNNRNKIDFNV